MTPPKEPRPLTSTVAETETDKIASLRLIADSIAQQHQTAAKAIILHPFWLATIAVCLTLTYRVLLRNQSDWPAVVLTWAGCVMAGLVAVRYLTASYLEHAERTGTWKWLYEGSGHRAGARRVDGVCDHILITKLGDEVIGVLILRPVYTSAGIEPHIRGARHFVRGQEMCFPVGVIRAWTVQRRYRGEGVGRELLQRAVGLCRAQGWGGPIFSQKHANAAQGVARWAFEGGESRARTLLAKMIRGSR
ncbi:hypothetical protein P170DRAFT_366188 [Aspergillus steynii IBT 23096]|uniref:N-acetyltransferase domain-containing protein n=1 Tax=Aspergillus steynii IBT 23096 TaxID=1392250 RepID=A0A2I2FVY0_9EURO|nr:uncharacterized protein P170DRAFT_366188 [Aspergillus steynii IBT 23096]PLB44799.1 hypothetical protein P170DRAFT_366188 [Aspergillus steynii IBT 23096]